MISRAAPTNQVGECRRTGSARPPDNDEPGGAGGQALAVRDSGRATRAVPPWCGTLPLSWSAEATTLTPPLRPELALDPQHPRRLQPAPNHHPLTSRPSAPDLPPLDRPVFRSHAEPTQELHVPSLTSLSQPEARVWALVARRSAPSGSKLAQALERCACSMGILSVSWVRAWSRGGRGRGRLGRGGSW